MERDSRFEEGCHYFDSGNYFEAHESWEEVWNDQSGLERHLIQGLIQVAVALHHASQGNDRGARKLLASSLTYLEKGMPVAVTVDVKKIKDHILDFELALQKKISNQSILLPYFKLPRLK